MSERLSCVVVGAGITGASTAEWLRRAGHNVLLVDRNRPGGPEQTSYGNAGILARSSVVPVSVPGLWRKVPSMLMDPNSPLFLKWSYLPRLLPWVIPFLRNGSADRVAEIASGLDTLLNDSVDQHLSLAKGTPAERFISTGEYAYLYRDRAAYLADAFGWDLRRKHGFKWRELDRAALLDQDPHIGPAYTHGVFMADHGWIRNPGGYVAAIVDWFTGQGGAFQQGSVDDISPLDGGRAAVTIDGERREADRVVVATGAWSSKLAKTVGHKPALESERGYHLLLKGPSITPPIPYMIADAKFVATPMDLGVRLAGQVEFGGLDAEPSKAPMELFKRRIADVYPDLEWEAEEGWMGHRPSTTDSLPLIGPSPKAPGVFFAFGAQHVGLTAGPKTGRWIADMVSGNEPNVDLRAFRVERFD